MLVHSSPKFKKRDWTKLKFKELGSHKNFLERITKTFYYGNLPLTERLSLPVTELAADLYSEVKAGNSVQRLRLEEASAISRNACVSPCSLVLAVIYLEQLKAKNFSYVDKVTPSDLFIVSLIVATKFLNDSGEEDDILNSEWAASVDLTLNEVNRLEKEFLAAIEWEVFVEQHKFWKRLRSLERDVALKEGSKRGWFSYSDLENLLDTVNALALAQTIFTVSAVCLASYTAALLTMVGSTFLVSQIPKVSLSHHTNVDLAQDVLNVSTSSATTLFSLRTYDDSPVTDCEHLCSNVNTEYSIKEISDYLEADNLRWDLESEKNFSSYIDGYIDLINNYLSVFSDNVEYLPLKIGTLPLDGSCLLNSCYS